MSILLKNCGLGSTATSGSIAGGAILNVWELGAHAFASSCSNRYYNPPDYTMRSHVAMDLWENLCWVSNQTVDDFNTCWIAYDLGRVAGISGWTMLQSDRSSEQASSYEVWSSINNVDWLLVDTHTTGSPGGYPYEEVDFAGIEYGRFWKFKPITNRMSLIDAQWWLVFNIGIVEADTPAQPKPTNGIVDIFGVYYL